MKDRDGGGVAPHLQGKLRWSITQPPLTRAPGDRETFSHMPVPGSLWQQMEHFTGPLSPVFFSITYKTTWKYSQWEKILAHRAGSGCSLSRVHRTWGLLLQKTMSSAMPSRGKDPEGRGNLCSDSRRRDMGDCNCINPQRHILLLVLFFCKAQKTPEKLLLWVNVIGD